jgi:hypothetical protein
MGEEAYIYDICGKLDLDVDGIREIGWGMDWNYLAEDRDQ